MTKTAENHTLWGSTYLFLSHLRECTPRSYKKKNHFPGKTPIYKDQQIDYFLLINNAPDFFKKIPIPFLNNNNSNLFLNSNSLFELSRSLLHIHNNCAGTCSLRPKVYTLQKTPDRRLLKGTNNSYHGVALRSL